MAPEQKTIVLHVGALNALVLGMFAVMAGRDPEMVREIIDAAEEVAGTHTGHQQEDIKALQDILAGLVGPIRMALRELEQAAEAKKH